VWLGTIGFIDDYIKVFKKDKRGLAGKFKMVGQVGLGIIIGATVYFHPEIRTKVEVSEVLAQQLDPAELNTITEEDGTVHYMLNRKSPNTTIPFVKDNEFNYSSILGSSVGARQYTWIMYILVVIFIITAVSNGANITDGVDGLATGTSAIMVLALGILAYVSGNVIFSQYLDIMYIPGSASWRCSSAHCSVPASASSGTTPIRHRSSWAIPAAWRSAASSPRWPSWCARNC
jgi:phospho-N-acetylmuramoyl-pentapeptide-transferase